MKQTNGPIERGIQLESVMSNEWWEDAFSRGICNPACVKNETWKLTMAV
jgi:hypothetical protein